MQNRLWRKGLVITIIILFIGTNTISSINTRNIQITNESNNKSSTLIDEGLIGYWNLNEGTGYTVHDTSGGGNVNDGTIYGSVAWTTNTPTGNGFALAFHDYYGEYVDISNVGDFAFVNHDLTFTCWVTILDNANDYRPFIFLGDTNNPEPHIVLEKCRSGASDGRIIFQIVNTASQTLSVSSIDDGNTLPKETWLFLAGVVDHSSNSVSLYINGALQGSVDVIDFDLTQAPNLKLYFGSSTYAASTWGPHNGNIDDVRIYDRALSQSEIWELYGVGNQPFYFVHITDTHVNIDEPAALYRLSDTLEKLRTYNPKPSFIVISGDLVEDGNHGFPLHTGENYVLFKSIFYGGSSMLYLDSDETIPVYLSPGNHDHRWIYGLLGYDLNFDYPGENNHHCYSKDFKNTRIFSIDTGSDEFDIGSLWVPESNGLSLDNINWLDNFLGKNINDILFFHHPWLNYYTGDDGIWGKGEGWGEGCFFHQRDEFKSLINQYNVPLILSGHIHWDQVYQYEPSSDEFSKITYHDDHDDYGYYYEIKSGEDYSRTLNVQGSAHRDTSRFRLIKVDGNDIKVYEQDNSKDVSYIKYYGVYIMKNELGNETNISHIAKLHIYDSQGNHLGLNENGTIDYEIDGGVYYPIFLEQNITAGYDASVYYGQDNYSYEIDGVGDGDVKIEIGYLIGQGSVITKYENVSINNGCVAKVYLRKDTVDYTMFVDQDGDGIVDYELEPTEIITNPPYRPERIEGPSLGKTGDEYSYSTTTSDSNGDQIYYLWDWGDGNQSNWLGPYDSGQEMSATHQWKKSGIYEIKVKAKDTNGDESDWSESISTQILQPTIIIGLINGTNETGECITFNAKFLLILPSNSKIYTAGEKLMISKDDQIGFFGSSFIIGIFDTIIISEQPSIHLKKLMSPNP